MDAGTNQQVARIGHSLKVGKRDVWTTTVPAGVDMAFMAACTLILDEILETWEDHVYNGVKSSRDIIMLPLPLTLEIEIMWQSGSIVRPLCIGNA